jgi:hypothetical protein
MRSLLAVPLLLAALTTLALPPAEAVDLCAYYGICVPPTGGCTVNLYAVRVDSCTGRVQLCTARYMGGGSGGPLGNFVWTCSDVLA